MAPYIFFMENGIHIIDLKKMLVLLDYAATAIRVTSRKAVAKSCS
jgi:ribosomal protein S2